MPLTMRPTGLGSGVDKDRPDYIVYCGGWAIGRIYETRGGPDSLRWFWSMTVNGPMRGSRGDLAAARSRKLDRRRRSADLHGLRQRLIFLRRLRAVYSL